VSRKWWWIIAGVVGVGVVLAVVVGLFAYHANSENRAANDAYANSVCTAIGSWEQQLKTIGASGGTSQADLEQAAKQQLAQLSTDLTNSVQATKNGVATIKADASAATISTVAVTLRDQYKALADSAKSAADSLGGNALPLALAFRRTNACKNL